VRFLRLRDGRQRSAIITGSRGQTQSPIRQVEKLPGNWTRAVGNRTLPEEFADRRNEPPIRQQKTMIALLTFDSRQSTWNTDQ
jgi:hypothetical protein